MSIVVAIPPQIFQDPAKKALYLANLAARKAAADERVQKRARTEPTSAKDAMAQVMENPDLVRHIICGNLGISSYCALAQTNRATHEFLNNDGDVLWSVATFTRGLTKNDFLLFFAIDELLLSRMWVPYAQHKHYRLYNEFAIQQAIAYEGPRGVARRRRAKMGLCLREAAQRQRGISQYNQRNHLHVKRSSLSRLRREEMHKRTVPERWPRHECYEVDDDKPLWNQVWV